MLPINFVQPARERIAVEIAEQSRRLTENIEALKSRNAARGGFVRGQLSSRPRLCAVRCWSSGPNSVGRL